MPNQAFLQRMEQERRKRYKAAPKAYRRYRDQVPALLQDLAEDQDAHDRAFDLLLSMGNYIIPELLQALAAPELEPDAQAKVVALLGMTADPKAQSALWDFFQANLDDQDMASTVTLALASSGDERVLPWVRQQLLSSDEEIVSNAVVCLLSLGELQDVETLRWLHRRFSDDLDIGVEIAHAIITIIQQADEKTFAFKMDDIMSNPEDEELWDDMWFLLQQIYET